MTPRAWWVAVGLLAAVLAAHGGALRGGFHYDDNPAIAENPSIRSFQPLVYFSSQRASSSVQDSAGFRPVTVLTFAVNYAMGRLDPFGYLALNLALHVLIAWMVFVVGRVLLGDGRWAAAAALLYAVHPLNAESVNYVVARSSLLAALFGVVTVWALFRRRADGGPWWTAVGVGAFVLALLSKESGAAVIVPLAAAVLLNPESTAVPGGRRAWERGGEALRQLWPYLATLGAYLFLWWSMVGTRLEQRGAVAAYPVWTFVEMVWRSLGLWVVPWPLGLDHPLTFVDTFDGGFAAVLAAGTIVAAGLTAWAWRRLPMAAWCAVWAVSGFLPLAPLPWNTVKGLLQENRAAFSAVALAWLTAAAARGLVALTRRVAPRVPAPALLGVGLLLVAGAVSMDRDRARVWGDEVRLWEEAARLSPKSRGAQVNLGGAYLARLDFDRAEAAYRRALALTPDQALPYYALGMLAYRRGHDDEAVAWLMKTASLAPDYAKTYRMLGVLAIRQGRDADARSSLRRALALDPRDATAMAHLGLVAQRAGDDAAAERWFLDAIALDPAQPLARNNLGTLYLARRRWAEALDQFSALLVHAPNDYDAALNRSVALDALGRKAEARAAIQALLARLPADPRYDQHRRSASFILSRSRP